MYTRAWKFRKLPKMKLLFAFVLFTVAQAASFTDLAAFQDAATGAGATAQSTLAGSLNTKFQGACKTGVTMVYTTTFSGTSQDLTLSCASPTAFSQSTCSARLTHIFVITDSCVAGDTLTINITNGPPDVYVC